MQFAHVARDQMFSARESHGVLLEEKTLHELQSYCQFCGRNSIDSIERKREVPLEIQTKKGLEDIRKPIIKLYNSNNTDVGGFTSKFLGRGKKNRRDSNANCNSSTTATHFDNKNEYHVSMNSNGQRTASGAGTSILNSLPPRKESISSHSVPISRASSQEFVQDIGNQMDNSMLSPSPTEYTANHQTRPMLYSIPERSESVYSNAGISIKHTTAEEDSNKSLNFQQEISTDEWYSEHAELSDSSIKPPQAIFDRVDKEERVLEIYKILDGHSQPIEFILNPCFIEDILCQPVHTKPNEPVENSNKTKDDSLSKENSDHERNTEPETNSTEVLLYNQEIARDMEKMSQEQELLRKEVKQLQRLLKAEKEAKEQIYISLENARQQFDRVSTASFLRVREVSRENRRLSDKLKALSEHLTSPKNPTQEIKQMPPAKWYI